MHQAVFFPPYLRGLSSLVLAALTREGFLLEANRGFSLATQLPEVVPYQCDVSQLFINPGFSQIATVISGDAVLYQGILNLGVRDRSCISVQGTVLGMGEILLLVAERDLAEIERLTASVLELNQEMADMQRQLMRKNLALQRSQAQVRELLETDPLSGIANRRTLGDRMELEYERATRFGHPLSLIMVDIDHFKHINDALGHQKGDEAIRLVADILREGSRKIDLAARYGGEEFVVVLPECHMVDGMAMAERLRVDLAERSSSVVPGGFTGSFGVATLLAGEDPCGLLKRADKALYMAKESGRNRVVSADG